MVGKHPLKAKKGGVKKNEALEIKQGAFWDVEQNYQLSQNAPFFYNLICRDEAVPKDGRRGSASSLRN
ncbi:MAG: hypothetical protein V1768_03805 [Patescibacteria group bacterium]